MKNRLNLLGWLHRLSVRSQLLSAFGAILVLTAMLGVAALLGLRSVDSEAIALSQKWLKGVGALSDARTLVVEYREYEKKHSRTDDASYHAEYEDKMKELGKTLRDLFDAYQNRVTGDAEKALVSKLTAAWAGYQQANEKVVKLGRDKQQMDAADLADGLSSMAFDEVESALTALIQFNYEGGETSSHNVKDIYERARYAVIGLLAASLVIGVVLSLAIARNLLRQLGGEPRTAVSIARAVAEGDLTTPIRVEEGDTDSLLGRLQTMQQSLATAVTEVRRCSDYVSHASAEIASGNQDLSTRTEHQASELQQTAATMEQLGATVRHNADNAVQASQLARSASAVARQGGEVVERVVQTMKGINESSRKIGDIIGVIDGIAFQTNILALNAAVEAARAGEQGRGFAVVAGEVRSLAQRSAEAAKEIKALIGASVERVEQGSSLVNQAGTTMHEVVESIRRVSDIVEEISAASSEQSSGVTQVGQAISRMDQTTQQNAALVEQSAAAAGSLQQQAEQLVSSVSVFKTQGLAH